MLVLEKNPPLAAERAFPVPTGTLCRLTGPRCMTASPPALCNLLFPQPDWAVSESPDSLLTSLSMQFCTACNHCEHALLQHKTPILKISACFLVILFNSCSFYFTSAWITSFQAQKMNYLMPSHAALQTNSRF